MSIVLGSVWFAASYGGWVWTSRKRGWSGLVAFGGGFVYAIASLAAVVWVGSRIVLDARAEEIAAPRPTLAIRQSIVGGCVVRGMRDGGDAVAIARLCDCYYEVISKGMTLAEYAEVEGAGKSGFDTLPQMRRLKPKLQACSRFE